MFEGRGGACRGAAAAPIRTHHVVGSVSAAGRWGSRGEEVNNRTSPRCTVPTRLQPRGSSRQNAGIHGVHVGTGFPLVC